MSLTPGEDGSRAQESNMRILVVSQYYPPEGPAAFYACSIAREMSRRSHRTRVLTGFPNYPTGKLFPGYVMKGRQRESDEGVEVLRVPLYLDHSQNAVRRMVNYISFGLSSALAYSWSRGADVVYVYAPQMTAALGPWLWRLFGGPPYVLHVQDLWPESITGSSLVKEGFTSRIIELVLKPWIRSVYRKSAAVIGIAPTMIETLAERGVDRSKLRMVFNWTDETRLQEVVRAARTDRETVSILFAGNIGVLQNLEVAVRAAHAAADAGVWLDIVGDGVALDDVRSVAKQIEAKNVAFHDAVPRASMGEYYARADYALVTLKDLAVFRGTIPSKFQSSLAHGLPVISSVQGDVRDIIEHAEIGFTAESESVSSLEEAFRLAVKVSPERRSDMARRARATYVEQFSQDAGVDAIQSVLAQVVGGSLADR